MRLTLLRLAAVRLRHQWPLAVAQLVGLAAAVGLAMSVPLVQATASEAGLHQVVDRLGSQRFVTAEQLQVGDVKTYDAFQQDAEHHIRDAAGANLQPAARYVEGPAQAVYQKNGKPFTIDDGPGPDIASWEGLAQHVRVVSGSFPPDRPGGSLYPVAIAAGGARDFAIAAGDVVCMAATRGDNWCAQVTAIYEPASTSDPYWAGTIPQHSLMLGRAAYWALVDDVNAHIPPPAPGPNQPPPVRATLFRGTAAQAWQPALANLHARDISQLATRLNHLRGYFTVQREGLFLTGLDTAVKSFAAHYNVASFTIQIVGVALLVIALYSLSFVATHFFDAQGGLMAVLRGRGWSRLRVWALLMTEVALLALIAIPAGLVAAYLLSVAAGSAVFGGAAPHLGSADLVSLAPFAGAAVLAALGILAALAAATSRRGVLEVRRGASRADERPWWQWRNLDLGLALLAIPLVIEVQLRGSSAVRAASAAAEGDLTGLLLPALALVLLAVASLRLLPLAARAVGLAGRGLPADLASWQLTRQPAQSARLAILLTLTVAVGTFSSVYAATDHRNTIDRAGYAAGSDLRADFTGSNQNPPNVAEQLSGVPDVAIASTTYRGAVTPGRSNLDATVLAIDAGTFRQVAWKRGDLAAEPLDLLTQKLVDADPDGVVLPGRPETISIWTNSAGFAASLTADVTDGTGAHCACPLGDLSIGGARVLSAPIGFAGPARYPLRLRGLQVRVTGSTPVHVDLALGQLQVAAAGAAPAVVEGFTSHDGWWQETLGRASFEDDLQPSLKHPRDGQPTVSLDLVISPGTPLLLRPAPSAQPVPALVSSATLAQLGVGLNQPFPMHVDEVVVNVAAVATVDYFPTLYPGRDQFLVVPRDTLLGRLGHEHNSLAWPNEAWLRVDGDAGAVSAALGKAPGLVAISDRHAITSAALDDPLRLALQATLAIGFAAALAMAVVGFALHFLVAARSRLSQYAILQANGLPRSMVARSLLAEQMTMLLHGLLVGGILALGLAWAILPSVQVSADLADLVPPTILTVDPLTLIAVLAAVAAAALFAGQLASRVGGRFHLLDELRLLG